MSFSNGELVFNLWATLDGSLGYIYALAGKAYRISGSDQEKLAVLKALAATESLIDLQFNTPME